MCIYLSDNAIFVLIFIAGLVLGAIVQRIITAPKKPAKPIDYNGTNGRGYQPRPAPPKPLPNPNKWANTMTNKSRILRAVLIAIDIALVAYTKRRKKDNQDRR